MLEKRIEDHLDLLVERYPVLQSVKKEMAKAYSMIADCYQNGGKLLIAGNGGSAAVEAYIQAHGLYQEEDR